MTDISDGVRRFGEGGVHFYVIEGDDGLTLVDAGLPGLWKPFATFLHRNGLAPRDVRAVLLTHHHADHVGFAARALDHGADVRAHADDLARIRRRSASALPRRFARNAWRPGVAMRAVQWLWRGFTRVPAVAGVTPCGDGERLDVPGRPTVVHVPGHTAGSAAYVFADHGVVCTGDALVTADPVTARPGIGICPAGLNADDGQALASLERLADVDAALILPGHGAPYRHGIASALQAARAIGAAW